MSIVGCSDAELVSKYVKGQEHALECLILRHSDSLLRKIYAKVLDEDLTQDIHQEVWMKFIRVVKAKDYQEKGKFAAYIHRMAGNMVIDHFRRQKRNPELSMERCGDSVLGVTEEGLNAEELALQTQWHSDVKTAMEQLGEEQREVVFLRIYAGLSFKEIAEETAVGINTALGRYRYALNNLRKILGVEID
ncbi:MAG TPA: RNA polymerase subunit sigma-24 [Cryomorphaceae bacterium]|nr:RNA polymerase subunit sigma-24 [Cryomorphaceae bacterium]